MNDLLLFGWRKLWNYLKNMLQIWNYKNLVWQRQADEEEQHSHSKVQNSHTAGRNFQVVPGKTPHSPFTTRQGVTNDSIPYFHPKVTKLLTNLQSCKHAMPHVIAKNCHWRRCTSRGRLFHCTALHCLFSTDAAGKSLLHDFDFISRVIHFPFCHFSTKQMAKSWKKFAVAAWFIHFICTPGISAEIPRTTSVLLLDGNKSCALQRYIIGFSCFVVPRVDFPSCWMLQLSSTEFGLAWGWRRRQAVCWSGIGIDST